MKAEDQSSNDDSGVLGPEGVSRGPSPRMGSYRLVRQIGRGGSGRVFQGIDASTGEHVSIKWVVSSRSGPTFAREVEATCGLRHCRIVRGIKAGRVGKNGFLVMEYIDGRNLGEIVRRDGSVNVRDSLSWMIQVCEGLEYLHESGWIHRDIKPENVMVSGDGMVKLVDFGAARRIGGVDVDAVVWGSMRYLAPEQFLTPVAVDQTCDLYGLGASAFALLHGRSHRPRGTAAGLMLWSLTDAARRPPLFRDDLPVGLTNLLSELIAWSPRDRPQSAKEVLERLREIATLVSR